MDYDETCDCESESSPLTGWKLSWVDPAMWLCTILSGLGQTAQNLAATMNTALGMHANYVKERDDFAAEAGREIEKLTSEITGG